VTVVMAETVGGSHFLTVAVVMAETVGGSHFLTDLTFKKLQ
jgi:hypothetical protein